ncbi:MAG: hypothetical protein NZV14_04865 [Bryobacteraceae bacterium]|nr:hypothetical protein [Bryobacteraceae bacterium]MDW8377466.1 hypothetical protein [Bryobacterales bacterium]
MKLTSALAREYQAFFQACEIRPDRAAFVDALVDRILQYKLRYETVGRPLGIPWYFIAAIHSLECGLKFSLHLHNGDPLTRRTVRSPRGRPKLGNPPFRWEESAADALQWRGLEKWQNWSTAGLLYQLEAYNGFGYRMRALPSPYLWSFSTHYEKGKFVSDGVFSSESISQQCGGATLWRRMAERKLIELDSERFPPTGVDPRTASGEILQLGSQVSYSTDRPTEAARQLQRLLNQVPGIYLRVDGLAGERTSDAFQKVTGSYLPGDPRGEPARQPSKSA